LGNSLLLRYKCKENSKKSSTSLENGEKDGVEIENKEEEKNELNFEIEKSSENGSPENKRKKMSSTAAEWENCNLQSNGIVPKRNKTIFEMEEDELSAIEGSVRQPDRTCRYNLYHITCLDPVRRTEAVHFWLKINLHDSIHLSNQILNLSKNGQVSLNLFEKKQARSGPDQLRTWSMLHGQM